MELKLPAYTAQLDKNEQVRALQKGSGSNAYIELRIWRRSRGRGWQPTQLVSIVPCGELAVMWDRMTTELNGKMEQAVQTLRRASEIDHQRGDEGVRKDV